MRTEIVMLLGFLVLVSLDVGAAGRIQEESKEESPALDPAMEKRIRDFEKEMSGAELLGSFTVDGAEEQKLHADRYSLKQVQYLHGDYWKFEARIRYGDRDVTVPIPLEIRWAGDTPVVTLTDFTIPGLGKYTARVLFYRGRYAGTWWADDHGGQMFGKIVRPPQGTATDKEIKKEDEPGKGGSPPPTKTDGGAAQAESTSSSAGEAGATRDHAVDLRSSEPTLTGDPGRQFCFRVEEEEKTAANDKRPRQCWPQFRGPAAGGVADGYPLPVEWDVEAGTNVRWSTEIPGLCHSCPIVWNDLVFVTSAVSVSDAELKVGLYGNIDPVDDEGEHQFNVYCLERSSGDILWEETACSATPKIKRHPKGSHHASTPATDGEHVVAMFASEGLYCYDLDGILLWKKDLGVLDSGYYHVPDAQWGFATSPVIHEGVLIIQADVQKGSFLAAYDVHTGEEKWKVARDEVPTWSSPTILSAKEGAQILVNGYRHIGGYELATGKEIWKLNDGGDIPVPTPVVAHDLIFITNGHLKPAPICAIRSDARGDLKKTSDGNQMAWFNPNRGNYMQTPLVVGEHLYCCNDAGILSCLEAKTGKEIYRERLGKGQSGFTASGVAGDGKLYFTSEVGEIFVVRAGPEFERLAMNEMKEECMATPALSEGTLFIRGRRQLFALEESASKK